VRMKKITSKGMEDIMSHTQNGAEVSLAALVSAEDVE